ncbi:MAG TPA: ergothioneine biosynthesis protein EgtB, partial [Candidatus Eisenbacteria bacterium]|nr:ergothioneine biosynthesis protein EgtB [Candidatus Eisenbacteria bacterium]
MMQADRFTLLERYRSIRRVTEALCEPLEVEDYVIQSMPEASPAKWHLAHTSWFFETFVLEPAVHDYQPLDDRYRFLFNSYY